MKFTNYHTHCYYCDGQLKPEDYVKSAIVKRMDVLGFSSHAPVPFSSDWNMQAADLPKYINEIESLKTKYNGQIEIYTGLEIDHIKGICGINNFMSEPIDYSIGGVHYLGQFDNGNYFEIDYTPEQFQLGLKQIHEGSIKTMLEKYYFQVCDMIENQPPDIIAHIDLVKKFNIDNRFFDETENWYRSFVFNTLEIVAKSDCKLEINTKGQLAKYPNEIYPSLFILKKSRELNIPIVINADAHHPNQLDYYFDESKQLLKEIGYREICIFKNYNWTMMQI